MYVTHFKTLLYEKIYSSE